MFPRGLATHRGGAWTKLIGDAQQPRSFRFCVANDGTGGDAIGRLGK